ncbi:MAG TPA: carbohydrate-binding family 9-like protein [Thermoanaerobaculia bacterium]|nr:carbohydrate-binding family 9-like protein [Thermoanaerobaculia bacterium]
MPSAPALPHRHVPHVPGLGDPLSPVWDAIPSFPPFLRSGGGGPALQQTRLRVAWDGEALFVRFDCKDRDAWGTFMRRDDPLYEEEAVEVFLAVGTADPVEYFEFEVSPLGVLWDGRIHNPTSRRQDLVSDKSWDCPGIHWAAGKGGAHQDWWAFLSIPWRGVCTLDPGAPFPRLWRANFYRIERPRDGAEPEFSAWSPTFATPPDFHQPARFGVLELAGGSRSR